MDITFLGINTRKECPSPFTRDSTVKRKKKCLGKDEKNQCRFETSEWVLKIHQLRTERERM
jgi:hypothetical protein